MDFQLSFTAVTTRARKQHTLIASRYLSRSCYRLIQCTCIALQRDYKSLRPGRRYFQECTLDFHPSCTHHVEYPDVVKIISLLNILLESDCPFLPNRAVGEPQNTPWSVVNIAQKISEVIGQNTLTIMKYMAQNAKDFYNI